ncbi:MAG: DNA polymerase [Patescibacteria group bacterium]
MAVKKKQENTTPKRLILLDSHAILHRAYHALPDFSTAKGEPTGALYGLSSMLIKIIEDLKPDYVVACYDVKGPTHRHKAYKEYKAQRKEIEDDLIKQLIRSRDIFHALNIPIYDKEGFEADDMLGTIVEQIKGKIQNSKPEILDKLKTKKPKPKKDTEIIIASGDMDTLQLVQGDEVKVYTFKKGIKDTIIYNEKAVYDRFGFGPELMADYKGLRGDPSDNIVGIKGVGEKTATTLITNFGSIEKIYEELEAGNEEKFKKTGITPRIIQLLKDNKEEAEFSKMLATIRRDAPITFVLPEKTFRENLDIKKISQLWSELEFRTLVQRLQKVVGNNIPMSNSERNNDTELSSQMSRNQLLSLPSQAMLRKDDLADESQKTALALWLVNSNLTNPTLEDILNFANTDKFEEAKRVIFTELDKRGLRKVYEDIELPLIPIIEKMEKHGIKIDKELLSKLSKTYHTELTRLEKEIWKHAGVEFNINSPKQLGEILFDKMNLTVKNMKKTAGGARSTRESELEKLRDLHPIVPMIFEYRELAKLLSTYIDAIPPLLDINDRLHSNLISSGSTTGRMASQNPNLQNIPIKTELGRAIRGAFIADKGFRLCSFDYSQVELRIAAFISGDKKMIEIFQKGEDVHSSVASFVFKVPIDKVTAEMRRNAKAINFGIIYGMGVNALQQSIGTNRAEAQKFYNDYFSTFSTLAQYLNSVKVETTRRGFTETFFGRRRYFEGIKSKIPYIRASAERMAINSPIQGTGADIIKLAMVRIDEYISREKLEDDVFPLLQVHDELVYEIREDKTEKVAVEITKIMESVMSTKDTKGVIMKALASIGNNWGELK